MSLAELLKKLKEQIKQKVDSAGLIMISVAHNPKVKDEKWVRVSDVEALLSKYEEKLRKLRFELKEAQERHKENPTYAFLSGRIRQIDEILGEKLEKELEQ